MVKITRRVAEALVSHAVDEVLTTWFWTEE
jgi:hypothetical protein